MKVAAASKKRTTPTVTVRTVPLRPDRVEAFGRALEALARLGRDETPTEQKP